MGKENETNYGFYSKVLNKPFDTLDELKKAEAEHAAAENEKKKLVEVKKARADEVQAAYAEYIEACKAAKKIVAEAQAKASETIKVAEEKYNLLRRKFIEDYKSFHVSYYNDNGKETISVSDLFDAMSGVFRLF